MAQESHNPGRERMEPAFSALCLNEFPERLSLKKGPARRRIAPA